MAGFQNSDEDDSSGVEQQGGVLMEVVKKNLRPKVLAISSGGGHWIQLMRIRPAFSSCDVVYASVADAYAADVEGCRFETVRNGNLWSLWGLLVSAFGVGWLVLRVRPDVVVTTGAAPGYFAIMFGKILGARTLWLDSMANAGGLSMSGRKARKFADLCLTQWRHLSDEGGPDFRGAVFNHCGS